MQIYSDANEKKARIGRPRKSVDVERIVALYVKKQMSVRQVAAEVGVSHDTVAQRLREGGVRLRRWTLPGED